MPEKLTPELLLSAYSQGVFPMAQRRGGPIAWYTADPRAILPLDGFHVPRSLRKRVRSGRFQVTRDRAFAEVIHACAAPRPGEPETWINPEIERAYTQLAAMGQAHSIEAWEPTTDRSEPQLVGGLYGVSLGGAFFGESMFSRATDASKVCLVHLVEHLRARGYVLLDVQFSNPHLEQFGIVEIPQEAYLARLEKAIRMPVTWED